jgi:hypothetical protein
VIGSDSGQAQIDAITSGVEAGAITQNPVGMGEAMVKPAVAAINGESLPEGCGDGLLGVRPTPVSLGEFRVAVEFRPIVDPAPDLSSSSAAWCVGGQPLPERLEPLQTAPRRRRVCPAPRTRHAP